MFGNIILSLITIVFSLFFLFQSTSIPASKSTSTLGPAVWPTTLLTLMLVFGLWLLVTSLFKIRKEKQEFEAAKTEEKDFSKPVDGKVELEEENFEPSIVYPNRYLILFFILVVYVSLLSIVGFLIATPLLILVNTLVFGMRKWVRILSTSIFGSAIIFYVFIGVLSIPFPRGTGIFRTFTMMFY